MNWGSAGEFFAMGGYGLYVWGSFGVTAAALLIEVVLVRQRLPPPGAVCAGNLLPTGTLRTES
jgi:heme exporter protein D